MSFPAFILLWVIVLCAPGATALAQAPVTPSQAEASWDISSYAEEAGLKRRMVFDIAFTTNNWVWLATSDGLFHYDGYQWKRFTTTNGLPSNFIRTVTVARNGLLWVGTDKFAGTFDGQHFDFHGSDTHLPGRNVRRIIEDADGTIWFCCDRWPDPTSSGGLGLLKNGQWQHYALTDGLPSDHLLNMLITSAGQRIAMTTLGPAHWTGEQWRRLDEPGYPHKDHTWNMVESGSGVLFAEGQGSTLVYSDNQWRALPGESFPFCVTPDGDVVRVFADRQASRFYFSQWDRQAFQPASAAIPLAGLAWQTIKAAPDGSIWCVGRGTILRWAKKSQEWALYNHLPPPRFQDRSHGIWFANETNACRYDGLKFKHYDNLFYPLVEGGDGSVWGRSTGGVSRVKDGDTTFYPDFALSQMPLLRSIADHNGYPWLHSVAPERKGYAACYDGRRWSSIGAEVLADLSIFSSAADPTTGIWVTAAKIDAKDAGFLFHLDTNGVRQTILLDHPGIDLHQPKVHIDTSNLWLSAYNGLFRAPIRDPARLEKVTDPALGVIADGVSIGGITVFECVEGVDGRSSLWFCASNQWRAWKLDYGGAVSLCADGRILASDASRLLITDALLDFKPAGFQLPADAVINQIVSQNAKEYWLGTDAGTFCFRPSTSPPRTVADVVHEKVPRYGRFEAMPRGIKQFAPGSQAISCLYSWRFDGNDWTRFQPWPEEGLPVSGLKPDIHSFEIRARDAAGNTDTHGFLCRFSVASIPLQERAWFKPAVWLLAGLLAGLVLIAWRSRQSLAAYAATLELKVDERTAALQADIARREQTEEKLRMSESRFRGVFNSTYQLIGLLTPEGTILEVNQAALNLFHLRAADVIGKPFWETTYWSHSPALQEKVKKAIKDAAAGKPIRFEANHPGPDGRHLWVDFSIKQVCDSEGRILFLIPEGHDITEMKNASLERQSLQEQLSQAQKMESVGRLAGGVAHDFNNLLTAIYGNQELAIASLPAEEKEIREYLTESQQAARRAGELTQQLLAFSRKQILEMKKLDLNQVILGFGKMLKRLIGEDIEVRTNLLPSLGLVNADPAQMEQVLLNLAVNARDAMPKGGRLLIETANVELDEHYAALYPEVKAGCWVRLVVSDSGVGMDADTQKRIFEPFFTTKPMGKGTGLGLATVYGIIKQHEGHITIYSEVNKGATFKIYLPRLESDGADDIEQQPATVLHGTEKILVLEDEPAVRRITCRMLKNHGFQVIEAKDANDAVEQARKISDLDLLLTDVIMPDMSGLEAYKKISALCPGIKVLYCSGYTGSTIEHHGIIENDMQFLQKPFSSASLTRKVRETLDRDSDR